MLKLVMFDVIAAVKISKAAFALTLYSTMAIIVPHRKYEVGTLAVALLCYCFMLCYQFRPNKDI